MFFAGLRPGEARGARWEDYDGKRLFVTQSVWHTYTTTPKTEEAASPVPVIESLKIILDEVRRADGNPSSGPILRGPSGKPTNLDNLSKRVSGSASQSCRDRMARLVFVAARSCYHAGGIDSRRNGFEGLIAAHKPCDYDAALHP